MEKTHDLNANRDELNASSSSLKSIDVQQLWPFLEQEVKSIQNFLKFTIKI